MPPHARNAPMAQHILGKYDVGLVRSTDAQHTQMDTMQLQKRRLCTIGFFTLIDVRVWSAL